MEKFAETAFSEVGLDWSEYVVTSERYMRPNEVESLLGDPTKAKTELNWENKTSFNSGKTNGRV